MKKLILIAVVCAFMSVPALAGLYVVPGTATPGFAGQVALADNAFGDGTAEIPPFASLAGLGGVLDITATGLWGFGPAYIEGPDGGTTIFPSGPSNSAYNVHGIRTMDGPYNALSGVFLTDSAPSLPVPAALPAGGATLTPLLQQEFFIGSSLSGLVVPAGATRLFFGLHNGSQWNNNVGSVDVTVVPVPGAILLGILGLSVAGIKLRKFS